MQKGVEILDMKDRVGTEGVPTGRVISANGYKLMAHTLHVPAIPLLNAYLITQEIKRSVVMKSTVGKSNDQKPPHTVSEEMLRGVLYI